MRHKGVSYAKYGYIFSIPFVIAFLIFTLYPVIYTTFISFTDLKGMGKVDFNLLENPFQNYETILNNKTFRTAFSNTVKIWIINFIPQMGFALLLTAWFTSRRFKLKGQGAFKVLLYMPNIITAATIAILFSVLFMYPTGPINWLLLELGLADEPYYFANKKLASQLIVAFLQFWMWYGYTMLILISGALGLSVEMFEAAEIDGATGAQQFFTITLPNLRSIILYTLITSLIGGLQIFDIPRLLNNGMPDNATLSTSLFIFNQAFAGSYMYARAAAASMIMFLVIAVLSVIVFFLMRDKDEIKARKLEKAVRKEIMAGGVSK